MSKEEECIVEIGSVTLEHEQSNILRIKNFSSKTSTSIPILATIELLPFKGDTRNNTSNETYPVNNQYNDTFQERHNLFF